LLSCPAHLSCPRRRASSTPQRSGSIARTTFTGSPPTRGRLLAVMPAQAGIQYAAAQPLNRKESVYWVPAYAGTTANSGHCNLIVEVAPIGIRFFNQPNLPGPIPFLHLLFACDRRFYVGMNFIINKLGNTVSLGEAFYEPLAMLINPTN